MFKRILAAVLMGAIMLLFCACRNENISESGVSDREQAGVNEDNSSASGKELSGDAVEGDSEQIEGDPYLSITYNAVNLNKRIIYSYDINTKELKEECALPLLVYKNYTAVFCRNNNTVYYSGLADPENYAAGDSLWAYNITTGETAKIDDENRINYGFSLIDDDTLLVKALTDEKNVVPAFFDLTGKTYLYMPEIGDRPVQMISVNYDYQRKNFACIYCDYEELASSDYQEGKTEMTRYVALASEDLTIDPEKSFAYTAKFNEFNIEEAIQISENEFLVLVKKRNDYENIKYYSLVFEEEGAVFTEVESPYPDADYLENLCTVDGGKTFYFYLGEGDDKSGNPAGIYFYDTETGELTPVLLNAPEKDNGGRINFSLVGP